MPNRFDAHRADLKLAVIGSGIMGRGIAQISAQAGIKTLVFDANAAALAEAQMEIRSRFSSMAQKGKMSEAEATRATNNLQMITDIEGMRGCHIVIEAIKEDLEIKRALFRNLEEIVGEHCILATNTSSLSVTAIQAKLKQPGRFGGLHFFNPVPLMKIAEVITGLHSEEWVAAGLTALTHRLGHKSVRAKDFPGFIVNHAGRAYGTEALRILGENVSDEPTIDGILKAAGFRMGPFELLDLIGLDVSHTVMESLYDQFYQEPRFRPSPIAKIRLEGGLLGRKSGKGFYNYTSKEPGKTPAAKITSIKENFWLADGSSPGGKSVAALITKLGGTIETFKQPSANAIVIVTPMGKDTTSTVLDLQLNPEQTVAIDTIYPLDQHRTLMSNPATKTEVLNRARSFFEQDGGTIALIKDSGGFVAQRVLAMVVNIGCDIAQQGIAAPADIDLAVTLGLGYPKGPLALGDSIGPQVVLNILDELYEFYGDPRYRPSPWLKRRALLKLSLLTNNH